MVEAARQLRAAGAAPPLCIAIHAVFADAVDEELVAAGARGIVTCTTIPHVTNQICVADAIADVVRARLGRCPRVGARETCARHRGCGRPAPVRALRLEMARSSAWRHRT